ncbi:hypothetical protein ElyMa_000563200 [Elysia marginata]|uniref:Phytanoyl-CoA dioxygenase n=1 Tax=Elysia marginata TaxID=1093978 RepID=A0AAV4G3E1_9GAST|nr:hypothetical protein ElyMa_000563200 [Elysia marginata]
MFTQQNRQDLETKGVTVVRDVISLEDCDRHQQFFRDWLKTFPDGQWPQSRNSLIQKYSSGHLQPAWEVRLAAKSVFAQVWETNKLLSSMDAIAIGRPPEDGEENFWSEGDSWLHVDQTAERVGLHAYQGAVYLEDCDERDWTFEVMENSHLYFNEFMERTDQWQCRNLKGPDMDWLKSKGCKRLRVPCPKGGLLLWDSRLFHANARPVKGREHRGRWRFVVFVCMTPAAWATPSDLEVKRTAYKERKLTRHWPSQGVSVFSTFINRGQPRDPTELHHLPEVARTEEAKRLAGVLSYDDDDDDDNDDGACLEDAQQPRCSVCPTWNIDRWAAQIQDFKDGKNHQYKERTGKKTPFKAR